MVCACICFTIIILAMFLLFILMSAGVCSICEEYQEELDALRKTVIAQDKTIDKLTRMSCDKILDNIVKDSE